MCTIIKKIMNFKFERVEQKKRSFVIFDIRGQHFIICQLGFIVNILFRKYVKPNAMKIILMSEIFSYLFLNA